jgi:hypothetical protein
MIRVADPPHQTVTALDKIMFAVRKSRFPKEATNPIASNSCFAIDGIVDTVSGLGRKQATTSPQIPPSLRPGQWVG